MVKRFSVAAFSLMVFVFSFAGPTRCISQTQLNPRLTTKIARSVKRKEPDWRYVVGFCTCPPLLPSQLFDDFAQWDRRRANGTRERVGMQIYRIGSQKEISDFMKGFRTQRWTGGARVQKYDLGDEAYLVDDSQKNNGSIVKIANPVQIWMRKNNLVLNIDGELEGTVIRFAQYALQDLPRN